jgi:hypothetical protein
VAWGNHKEELCRLGNERTNQQTNSLNQVSAQAALATVLNPKWQALMANMACNMANEWLDRPAWKPRMTFWLVFMVEANLNKAHHLMTYLSILFLPIILSWLLTKLAETSHDLIHCWEWNHVHLAVRHYPRKHLKKKKARQPSKFKGQAQRKKSLMLTYLLPLALISFKVGCHVKHSLYHLQAALNINQYLPKIVAFAASTTLPYQVPSICFNTDSFVIGRDTFASIMIGNNPDQFENLKMHNNTEVEGIQGW